MADNKKTILFPKTIGAPLIDKLFKIKRRGIEGNIVLFKRPNQPPVTVGWRISYSKGAGKSLRSRVLNNRIFSTGTGIKSGIIKENIRSKRGPRFQINVKY